jgi:hypothetical protein
MADSITKKITTAVVNALANPGVTVNKQRSSNVAMNEMPMYSVYLKFEHPEPKGQSRRPVLMLRTLDLIVKVRVLGDDDDADPHRQFVIAKLGEDATLGGLVTNVSEGDSEWFTEEGIDGESTGAVLHFAVEYTTKPTDITAKP